MMFSPFSILQSSFSMFLFSENVFTIFVLGKFIFLFSFSKNILGKYSLKTLWIILDYSKA
ncbi:hypothetical protein LguiB_012467 [Lonicera macranthoides]